MYAAEHDVHPNCIDQSFQAHLEVDALTRPNLNDSTTNLVREWSVMAPQSAKIGDVARLARRSRAVEGIGLKRKGCISTQLTKFASELI